MKTATKTKTIKKRGRPAVAKNKEDTILSNGLTLRQWERIKKERGTGTATEKLRSIVDWYFAQMDTDVQDINEKLESAAYADRLAKEKK